MFEGVVQVSVRVRGRKREKEPNCCCLGDNFREPLYVGHVHVSTSNLCVLMCMCVCVCALGMEAGWEEDLDPS